MIVEDQKKELLEKGNAIRVSALEILNDSQSFRIKTRDFLFKKWFINEEIAILRSRFSSLYKNYFLPYDGEISRFSEALATTKEIHIEKNGTTRLPGLNDHILFSIYISQLSSQRETLRNLLRDVENRISSQEIEINRRTSSLLSLATMAIAVISIVIAAMGISLQKTQMGNEIEKININLAFENNNNKDLIGSIQAAEKNKDYGKFWSGHFYLNYSREYPHYNLSNYSAECLSAYQNYLNDLERENTMIDLINFLRQEFLVGNRNINQVNIEDLNKELIKYNTWAIGEVVALNNRKCFGFPPLALPEWLTAWPGHYLFLY